MSLDRTILPNGFTLDKVSPSPVQPRRLVNGVRLGEPVAGLYADTDPNSDLEVF